MGLELANISLVEGGAEWISDVSISFGVESRCHWWGIAWGQPDKGGFNYDLMACANSRQCGDDC